MTLSIHFKCSRFRISSHSRWNIMQKIIKFKGATQYCWLLVAVSEAVHSIDHPIYQTKHKKTEVDFIILVLSKMKFMRFKNLFFYVATYIGLKL